MTGKNNALLEEELKKRLNPEEYRVLREKGTEAPFSGKHVDNYAPGMYACKVCSNPLFSSDAKFDSGTGWPSFDQALHGAVELRPDGGLTEVFCARCGSHLGHVFDDGPPATTGRRHCINSVCLEFQEK